MKSPATEMLFHDQPAIVRQELLLGGRHVSGLTLWKFDMRVGSALLRMGGIGGVHTDPAHRNKGLAARVMVESMQYMLTQGYDVSLLFGITDFYHRWHFAPAMAAPSLAIETRNAERAEARYKVRPAEDKDLPVIRRIYERSNAGRTGTVVRPARLWKNFRKGSTWGTKVLPFVVTQGRRPVAYFVLDDKKIETIVCEVGALRPDAFSTIVNACALQAVARRDEYVRFCVPPDHPFLQHAILYGAEAQQFYPRANNAMVALVNQRTTLEKMLPEFTARLRRSCFCDWSGRISITTDLENTDLVVRHGEASLARRPGKSDGRLNGSQEGLGQLLMGYRSVDAVLADPGVRLSGKVQAVLEVLLPKGFPFIWPADHF